MGIVDTIREENRRKNKLNNDDEGIVGKIRRENRKMETKRTQTPATATRTTVPEVNTTRTQIPTPATTARMHAEAHRTGQIADDPKVRNQHLQEVIDEEKSQTSIPGKLKRAIGVLSPLASLSSASQESQVDNSYAQMFAPKEEPKPESPKKEAYKQRYNVSDAELNDEIAHAKYNALSDDQKRRAINATTQTGWTAEQISGKRLLKQDGYTDEDIANFGNIARQEKYSSIPSLPDFKTNSVNKIDMSNDATYQHMTDEEKGIYDYLKNTGRDDEASDYYWHTKPQVDKRVSDEIKAEEKALLDRMPTAGKIVAGVALTGYSAATSIPGSVESFLASAEDIASGRNPNGYDERHRTKWNANNAHDLVSEMIEKAAPNAKIGNVNLATAGYDVLYSTLQSMLGAGAAGRAYTVIMGMGAAAEEAEKLSEQGVDRTRIVENALAKGIAEAFFEKFSIDNLVKTKSITGWKSFLKESLKQAGIEGSEEVFTEISNQITDRIIMGEDGEYAQNVNDLMAQGMSEEDAKTAAARDVVSQVLLAGIEGFLSGGLAGAGMNAMQTNFNAKTGKQLRQNLSDEDIVNAYKDVSQEGGVSAEYANRFLDRIKGGKTLTNTQVGALANQSAAEMQEEIENAPKRDIQKRQEVITDVYNKNARLNTMLGNNKAEAVNGAVVDTTTPDFGESTIARIESIKDDGTVALENGNEANLDNLEFSTRSQEDLYRGTVALANELGLSTEDANAIVQAYNTTTDVTPAQYLVAAKESIVKGMYGIDSDIMTDSTYTDRFTPAQKEYFTSIGEKMQTLGTERAALGLSEEQERIGKKIEDAIRRDTDIVNNGKLGTVTLNGVVFDKKNYADYGAKMQNLTARQKATVRQGQALVKFTPGLNINFIESKKDGNRFYYVDENGVERTLDENGHYAPSKHQIVVDLNSGSAGEGMSSYTLAHELVHYVRDWSAESFKKMGEEVVKLTNGQKLNDKFTLNDLIHAKMRTENLSYDSAFEEVVAQSFESMLTDEDQNVIKMLSELNKADSKTFNFIQKYIVNMGKKIAAAYNAIKDESMSIEGKYIASLNDDYKRLQKLFAESVHAAGVAQSKALARMKNGGVAVVPDANITDKLISDNNIGVDQLNSGLPLSAADIHLEGKSQVRTDTVPEYKQIITVTASGKTARLYTIDKNGKKKVQKMTVKELRNMKLREYLETSEAFDRRCKEKNLNKEKEIKRCIDNIDKVFEETQEFLQKLQDDSKYRFIGLQDCENQNVIINYGDEIDPETGERIPTSIVLSAMVNNGEYQVNIDFTKVCARREALQKLLNKITKTAANTSVNGNEQRVNLTAENIYAINTMLAQEGIDTACLICFVESKRYNINSLYQEKFIDVWNKQVKAECKKLGIKPEYFSFSSRDVSSGKGQLTPAEIDQQENLVENYRKKYGGDLNVNENKKVDEGKVVKQIKDYITNAAKAYADGQTTGEANELKLLTLADLITPEGRTSLEQDHKTIEQLLAKRLGTSAPKSVEAYTPYNGEIELLEGSTSSVLTKDINKYLKSIGGVRSQSFSDFMGCHLYDVMQRTAALAARGFTAHTYTKEIYRAILFGMCGEKTNLSAVYEIKADVNSWDAGLNKKGDYALSDYNAKENGETEWVQSIDIAKSIKLQNTEGYSKDCGIIGVGHSWRHIMKMQSDPEIRMIIGYHRSSLPVIISDLSQMNKSADYTSVQNTLEFKGLAKNNYRTPDGVPSYATPPQDAKTFDIDGTKRKSSFSMRDNKYVAKRFASRSALKAEFLKNCRTINRNYEKLKGEERLAVETEAGRITLTDLLNYANENGLSLVTKKANKNDAVGHEVEIKKSREVLTADGQPVLTAKGKPKTEKYVTDSFHLYEDLENTSDPYLTADHYIAACLRNGLIPEFYEFTHKFDENGKLVPDVNYYKNLYDFNVIDRLGTIGEDGKFYNADGTIAYAPQTEVSVLDENGNCVWDTPEWREAREKCMDDANRRRAKAEMVNEKILKALVKNKYDAVRTAIDWRTGKDIKSPVAVSSLSKYTNTLPLVQDVKKQTRQSIDAFSKKATEPIDKEYANALKKYGEDSSEVKAIIERAAEEVGYNSPDLYHGTQKFGFTKFDLNRMDDRRSIFLTSDVNIAQSYSGVDEIRRIEYNIEKMSDEELVDFIKRNQVGTPFAVDINYVTKSDILSRAKDLEESITNTIKRVQKYYSGEQLNAEEQACIDRLLNGLNSFVTNKKATQVPGYVTFKELFPESNIVTSLEWLAEDKTFLKEYSEALGDKNGVFISTDSHSGHSKGISREQALGIALNLSKKGNYSLKARLGKSLVVDAKGSNWSHIPFNEYDILPPKSELDFYPHGPYYVLYNKETEEDIFMYPARGIKAAQNDTKAVIDELYEQAKKDAESRADDEFTAFHTTRQISKWAKENDYDSVEIKNVWDDGGRGRQRAPIGDIYIIFNPNDVKSLDPVTYDEDGNIIPLSERFNPKNDDIRWQKRDTRTQTEKDADTIKDLRELLKVQGKVAEFSSKSLQSIAKSLIGYSGTKETTDVNKVANELGKLYRWVVNTGIDTGTTDDEKTYAKIYAKTEKIAQALGVQQSDDLAREVIESMFAAERLKTVGTQYAEKIAELKAKHKDELFNEKLASDIYYGRKIKELREQRDRKLEEQRQHTAEQKAKERENRDVRQMKERIYKKYAELSKTLTSPTEKRYVSAELVSTVTEVLDSLNLMQSEVYMDGKRAGQTIKSKVRANEKLSLLKTKYDALQKDDTYKAIYDEVVSDMLQGIIERIGDTPVEDMTLAQMQDVYTLLNTLDHTIREAVKVTLDGKKIDAFETGLNMMRDTQSVRGKHERAPSKYLNSQLRADTMFNRFAGYTPNSDWGKMARRLNEGQNKMTSVIVEGTAAFQDLVNKTKELAKLTNYKDLVDIGLTDEYGHSVPITRGMMLSLYMHLQNEDNAKHAMSGGLTLPNIPAYYKGDNERAWGTESRRVRMPEAIDFLQRIENELTDYEREWVKRAHWFFDEYSRDILNEATMQAYGFKKANVDNYFPIRTDPKYRSAAFETIARNFSLENAGFMKERKHASNPILLEDLTDVIFDQLNKTARYAGIMPAVKDFNKVYNTILPEYTSSLQKVINDKFGEPGTRYIENLLADLQGARKSEKTELLGVNIDRARGHMAQAVLSLNLRVAASQAASYPTAAAEIGWKPLAKALAHGGEKNRVLSKADRELIAKYSPLLEWRIKGNSTTELGNIKDTRKGSEGWILQKTKGLMGWISAVDAATVGRLWYAAQYYVDDNTDLEKGTDEYYKKVAEVFNNVVEKTQPNYTVMQRPDVLRSTNNLVKAMTMFMTQRLQNFNILYDSAAQYAKQSKDYKAGVNNVTEDDVKQSQNQLVRAVSSQVVAGITLVGMKAIVDAIMHNVKRYKDDDDETWLSVLKTLGSDFLEAEASAVVFGSELYDMISSMITGERYYAPTVQGISAITDLMQDIQNLSSGMTQKKVIKLSTDICTFFGIPASQAKKYVDAITGWYEDITDGGGIYSNVE